MYSSNLGTSLNTGNVVGSYAISTADITSWLNAPSAAPIKPKRTRTTKTVDHKIFQACSEIVTDPFWREKFRLASIGKFPPKFSFHENVLSYKKGNRSQSVTLSIDPAVAAATAIDFFHSKGGIFSHQDEQNAIKFQSQQSTEIDEPLTWSGANKKVQETLIVYYVKNIRAVMNLSDSEADQLLRLIRWGISGKFFGNQNIVILGTRIQSITGLLWNPEKRVFYIDPTLKPISTRSCSKSSTAVVNKDLPRFSYKWENYLSRFDKRSRLNSSTTTITITDNTLDSMIVTDASNIITTDIDDDDDDDEE